MGKGGVGDVINNNYDTTNNNDNSVNNSHNDNSISNSYNTYQSSAKTSAEAAEAALDSLNSANDAEELQTKFIDYLQNALYHPYESDSKRGGIITMLNALPHSGDDASAGTIDACSDYTDIKSNVEEAIKQSSDWLNTFVQKEPHFQMSAETAISWAVQSSSHAKASNAAGLEAGSAAAAASSAGAAAGFAELASGRVSRGKELYKTFLNAYACLQYLDKALVFRSSAETAGSSSDAQEASIQLSIRCCLLRAQQAETLDTSTQPTGDCVTTNSGTSSVDVVKDAATDANKEADTTAEISNEINGFADECATAAEGCRSAVQSAIRSSVSLTGYNGEITKAALCWVDGTPAQKSASSIAARTRSQANTAKVDSSRTRQASDKASLASESYELAYNAEQKAADAADKAKIAAGSKLDTNNSDWSVTPSEWNEPHTVGDAYNGMIVASNAVTVASTSGPSELTWDSSGDPQPSGWGSTVTSIADVRDKAPEFLTETSEFDNKAKAESSSARAESIIANNAASSQSAGPNAKAQAKDAVSSVRDAAESAASADNSLDSARSSTQKAVSAAKLFLVSYNAAARANQDATAAAQLAGSASQSSSASWYLNPEEWKCSSAGTCSPQTSPGSAYEGMLIAEQAYRLGSTSLDIDVVKGVENRADGLLQVTTQKAEKASENADRARSESQAASLASSDPSAGRNAQVPARAATDSSSQAEKSRLSAANSLSVAKSKTSLATRSSSIFVSTYGAASEAWKYASGWKVEDGVPWKRPEEACVAPDIQSSIVEKQSCTACQDLDVGTAIKALGWSAGASGDDPEEGIRDLECESSTLNIYTQGLVQASKCLLCFDEVLGETDTSVKEKAQEIATRAKSISASSEAITSLVQENTGLANKSAGLNGAGINSVKVAAAAEDSLRYAEACQAKITAYSQSTISGAADVTTAIDLFNLCDDRAKRAEAEYNEIHKSWNIVLGEGEQDGGPMENLLDQIIGKLKISLGETSPYTLATLSKSSARVASQMLLYARRAKVRAGKAGDYYRESAVARAKTGAGANASVRSRGERSDEETDYLVALLDAFSPDSLPQIAAAIPPEDNSALYWWAKSVYLALDLSKAAGEAQNAAAEIAYLLSLVGSMPDQAVRSEFAAIQSNKNPLYCRTALPFLNRILLRPQTFVRTRADCPPCDADDPRVCTERINMRRKAEILQHRPVMRHKTQNFTKKQLYSAMARRGYKDSKTYGTQSWGKTNPNSLAPGLTPAPVGGQFNSQNQFPPINDPTRTACDLVPTQASRSDVPGDPSFLINLDPSVELTGVGPPVRHFPSGTIPARLAYEYNLASMDGGPPSAIVRPNDDPKSAPNALPPAFVLETVTVAAPQGLVCQSKPGCGGSGTGEKFCGSCP
jgi:hypothetical protein